MRHYVKQNFLRLIAICNLLAISISSSIGCSETSRRGTLPYYSLSNPLFMMTKVGTLEQEYQSTTGAAIIKLISSPKYYENDIYLQPGSAEEKLFLKSGSKTPQKNKYFTFEAEILKVIDDRYMVIHQNDIITLKNVFALSINDPLYQYYQINPNQNYMIFLAQEDKDKDKNIFWYSIRAAYYVKGTSVFATNDAESIDSYSGQTIDKLADVLKGVEPILES